MLSVWDICSLVLAIITLPLHIYILILLLFNLNHRNLKSKYFMFVISQGIIDILTILSQIAFQIAPDITQVAAYYWSLRASSLPAWTYIHMYFFLLARSVGVILICGQRYISIVCTYSYSNMFLNSIPGVCFILLHFSLAILVPLPTIYSQRGFEFANSNLDYKMTDQMMQIMNKNWRFGCIFIVCCLVISTILLILTYRSAAKKMHTKGMRFKCEIAILRSISLLYLAFVGLAVYSVAVFIFTSFGQLSLDEDLKFTLVSIFFSCVHPWAIAICFPFFRYKIFFWLHEPSQMRLSNNESMPKIAQISV